MGDKKYPTDEQKLILVEFLSEHPELISGVFTGEFTRQVNKKLWEQVADQLNSVIGGAKKDWLEWRKTWQDLKKNAVAKAGKNKKIMTGTGGGPAKLEVFTLWEQRILDLIPKCIIQGQSGVRESGSNLTFNFEADPLEKQSEIPTLNSDEPMELHNEDFSVEETHSPSEVQVRSDTPLVQAGATGDHSYSIKRQPLKRKIRNRTQTKLNRLKVSQELDFSRTRLLEMSKEQANETRNYRNEKLSLLRQICFELGEIKNALQPSE